MLWCRGFPDLTFVALSVVTHGGILVSDQGICRYLHRLDIWNDVRLAACFGRISVHLKPLAVEIVHLSADFAMRLPLSVNHILTLMRHIYSAWTLERAQRRV